MLDQLIKGGAAMGFVLFSYVQWGKFTSWILELSVTASDVVLTISEI